MLGLETAVYSIVGQYTYSGRVVDEKGAPIPFAKIYSSKNTGTVCNEKGIFEFRGNKKILVLYDGQTITQNNNNITNFDFSNSIMMTLV